MILTNCPNCGGTLLDSGFCPYCKTKVRYENEITISNRCKPVEILIKYIEEGDVPVAHMVSFRGTLTRVEEMYDPIYTDLGQGFHQLKNKPRITLEFEGTYL